MLSVWKSLPHGSSPVRAQEEEVQKRRPHLHQVWMQFQVPTRARQASVRPAADQVRVFPLRKDLQDGPPAAEPSDE